MRIDCALDVQCGQAFSFLSLAKAATAAALLVALVMYEGTKVSVQVASQTRSLPFFQGTTEIPSGHFPSAL